VCSPVILPPEAEGGELSIQGQPMLHIKILSQKKKRKQDLKTNLEKRTEWTRVAE
jgi:hypothetical protein